MTQGPQAAEHGTPSESPEPAALRVVRRVHAELSSPARDDLDLAGLPVVRGEHSLPAAAATLLTPLADVLMERRSSYRFARAPLPAADLSTLLRFSAGPQRSVSLPDGSQQVMRTAPTAGGLPSVHIYVVVAEPGDLPLGTHHYDPERHSLRSLRCGDPRPALRQVLVQRPFADGAPTFLALVARLDTTLTRYPARHYRQLHLDTGVLSQNIALVGTSLGLRSCFIAGFHDGAAQQLLDLDGFAFTTLFVALGTFPT